MLSHVGELSVPIVYYIFSIILSAILSGEIVALNMHPLEGY